MQCTFSLIELYDSNSMESATHLRRIKRGNSFDALNKNEQKILISYLLSSPLIFFKLQTSCSVILLAFSHVLNTLAIASLKRMSNNN